MALPLIFEYDRPDLKCGYVPKGDMHRTSLGWSLFNAQGRQVVETPIRSVSSGPGFISVNCGSLPTGSYFLSIRSPHGATQTFPVQVLR